MMNGLPKISVYARIRSFLEVMRSANATAAAVEARRAPQRRDLIRLGINPEAFAAIRRI